MWHKVFLSIFGDICQGFALLRYLVVVVALCKNCNENICKKQILNIFNSLQLKSGKALAQSMCMTAESVRGT